MPSSIALISITPPPPARTSSGSPATPMLSPIPALIATASSRLYKSRPAAISAPASSTPWSSIPATGFSRPLSRSPARPTPSPTRGPATTGTSRRSALRPPGTSATASSIAWSSMPPTAGSRPSSRWPTVFLPSPTGAPPTTALSSRSPSPAAAISATASSTPWNTIPPTATSRISSTSPATCTPSPTRGPAATAISRR